MNTYDVGDLVELRMEFYDNTVEPPALGDPTTIIVLIQSPDGTVSELDAADLSKAAVGTYTYLLTTDEPGTWRYRVVSTGIQSAGESSFAVRTPAVYAAPAVP